MIKKTLIRSLSKLLHIAGYDLQRTSKRSNYSYHNLLDRILQHKPGFRFLQIGGCDGKSFDPLYPYIKTYRGKISGVIVEPVSSYAKEIKMLYSEFTDIHVVQKAIHADEEKMKLFRADMDHSHKLPDYAKGVASFSKSHLLKFRIPEEYIFEEEVACISMENLFRDQEIDHLDLLQIDTEGYDSEIIKQIDFKHIKPSLIHFEHGLKDGTMDGVIISEVIALLNEYNYDVIVEDYNATAYLRELI